MGKESKIYHYMFDQQNIDELQMMVNEVANDSSLWMDLVYKPKSNQVEEENTPIIEIAEMRWDEEIRQTIVVKDMKLRAIPLD
jgi:hypothetical protein